MSKEKEQEWVWFKDLHVGDIFEGKIHYKDYSTPQPKWRTISGRFIVRQKRSAGLYRNAWYIFVSSDRKRPHTKEGASHNLALEGKIVGKSLQLVRDEINAFLDPKTGIIRVGCRYLDGEKIMKQIAKALGKTVITHP